MFEFLNLVQMVQKLLTFGNSPINRHLINKEQMQKANFFSFKHFITFSFEPIFKLFCKLSTLAQQVLIFNYALYCSLIIFAPY